MAYFPDPNSFTPSRTIPWNEMEFDPSQHAEVTCLAGHQGVSEFIYFFAENTKIPPKNKIL